jgi:hypothetical protein
METQYLKDLGEECFNQMKELNPGGGIKEFIRMAVEFGYKRALKDSTIQNEIEDGKDN